MSVLIKDMEMPKTAWYCSRKIDPDTRRCNYTGKEFEETLSLLIDRRCADCPLVEIPSDIDLIDKNKLYEKVAEWEAQALEQASKLAQTDNVEEWRRWSTILNERTAFKFDVIDAPVIIPAE